MSINKKLIFVSSVVVNKSGFESTMIPLLRHQSRNDLADPLEGLLVS